MVESQESVKRADAMATITLHDVPEEVVSRLERCARDHCRNLNSEMVTCLTRQSTVDASLDDWLGEVDALRSQLMGEPIPIEELVGATGRDLH